MLMSPHQSAFHGELQRRIHPWVQPVPGEDPGGTDLQNDRDWLTIREQIDRLAAPEPKPVHWDEILDRGSLLLRGRSKDLRVACYMAVALQHTQGLNGLATGLYLVAEMLNRYWPTMHPPLRRRRAREAALKWLVKRVETELEIYQIEATNYAAAHMFEIAVKYLAEATSQHFSTAVAPMSSILGRAQWYLYATRDSQPLHADNELRAPAASLQLKETNSGNTTSVDTLFGAELPSRSRKLEETFLPKAIENKQTMIRAVQGREEIMRCFQIMFELRPHLQTYNFVETVERLLSLGYQLIALYVQEQPMAVAGFRVGESLAWGKYVYIEDLVTSGTQRSQGYGDALFAWICKYAQEQGCQQLHLDSGVQRFAAHRFYLRQRMDISSHHFSLIL